MKTNLFFIGLTLSCIIILSQGQSCCTNNKITIQGIGQKRIKPDMAIMQLSMETQNFNITNALTQLDKKLDNLVTYFKGIGILHNDIRTTSLNVYPKYDNLTNQKILIAYKIKMSLKITIRGIQNGTQIITRIFTYLGSWNSRGIFTSLTGFAYDTQNPTQGRTEARNIAYQNAVKKANQYASLTGRKIGRAVIFNETLSYYSPLYNTTLQVPKQLLPKQKNFTQSNPNFVPYDVPIGQIIDAKVLFWPEIISIGNIIINSFVTISWDLI